MATVKFDFFGGNYVVTGASSGMGRLVASEIAESGGHVLAIARREEKLKELMEQYPQNIGIAPLDVCDGDALQRAISDFVSLHGKFNGAVHAAGISGSTPLRAYSEENAKRIMDVSFWAGIRMMQIVNKKRYSADGCSSVLFSSVSAYIGEKSLFAYSAAKAALQVAVRTMAKEVYKTGNRINTVSPGWVETEMTENEKAETGVNQEIFDRHLLGLGHPADVTGMVMFLLSDRARWITGQDFVVDGGYLLGGYN